MKLCMGIINVILMILSVSGIASCLILGEFKFAWLCVIPFIYTWGNYIAIARE